MLHSSDACMRQAIIWANAGILLIGPLGTSFSEISIGIQTFLFKKCAWKCRLRNGVHFVSASMCWWWHITWWRHQMETLSALLALCAGNSPVTGEFPSQRPVTRSFDVFFDLRLNERLSKQSRGWWFETTWRHYDVIVMNVVELGHHWFGRAIKLPWIFPGAPLKVNWAPKISRVTDMVQL